MRILAVVAGQYGQCIAAHIREHAPEGWGLIEIPAPHGLPVVVDEPDAYLPADLPSADLILFMAESDRVAQLLPALVGRTGARAWRCG